MNRKPLIVSLVAISLAAVACKNDPPHQKKPRLTKSECVDSYAPGLGEIMTLTQMRHAKLWFAGDAKNWDLADYEIDEIEEGFQDTMLYHPTHKSSPQPLTDLIPAMMTPSILEMRKAVKKKDSEAFTRAFDHFTQSCNSCHLATEFGFNHVIRPTKNFFPNQDFSIIPQQGQR